MEGSNVPRAVQGSAVEGSNVPRAGQGVRCGRFERTAGGAGVRCGRFERTTGGAGVRCGRFERTAGRAGSAVEGSNVPRAVQGSAMEGSNVPRAGQGPLQHRESSPNVSLNQQTCPLFCFFPVPLFSRIFLENGVDGRTVSRVDCGHKLGRLFCDGGYCRDAQRVRLPQEFLHRALRCGKLEARTQ